MTLLAMKLQLAAWATDHLKRHGLEIERLELGRAGEKPRILVRPTPRAPVLVGPVIEHTEADGTRVRVGELRLFNCRVQWRLN